MLCIVPFVMHMDEELPEKWLANISKKCIKDMNEAKLNQLMFIVNALIINVLTGLGMGYEQLFKNHLGVHYLTGRWSMNDRQFGWLRCRLWFLLIEVGCMLSGLVFALVLFRLFPHFVFGYFGISCGGIISGYMYATRPIRLYQRYGLIVAEGRQQGKSA